MKLVELRELVELLGRLGRPRGAAKLAQILATGPAPTRSELEDTVLDLMLAAGFARPEVGVPLDLPARTVIPDFRWPGQQLVVEADGAAWHDHKLAREDDVERQTLLQAVLRPAETIARIRAAGAPPER